MKPNAPSHTGEECAESQRLMDLQRICVGELPVWMRCHVRENQVLVDDDVVNAELVRRLRPVASGERVGAECVVRNTTPIRIRLMT